jgi:hypothetical protein
MAGVMGHGFTEIFIIVKGFIDAKDEHGGAIYGTFLGVVSRRDIKFISVMFSKEESPRALDWNDLLILHEEREKNIGRDPLIAHYEQELSKYLESNMALNNIARNRNAKQAEQAISRYCLERLQFKAVCFIEFFDAKESDLDFSKKSKEKKKPSAKIVQEFPDEAEEEKTPEAPKPAPSRDITSGDIFVKCDPVLDPVYGVAISDLKVGDLIMGKLPDDSIFYKVMERNSPSFDGSVIAKVKGVSGNDLGTATVSLELSDGVSGAMKLSGKVKVKLAEKKPDYSRGTQNISTIIIFAGAGVLVFIAVALLIRYMSY